MLSDKSIFGTHIPATSKVSAACGDTIFDLGATERSTFFIVGGADGFNLVSSWSSMHVKSRRGHIMSFIACESIHKQHIVILAHDFKIIINIFFLIR